MGIPKASQGVKLPDLVKPVLSDSGDSTDDDSDDTDDTDSLDATDDSCDSCDSDNSSDTSESDKASHISYFDAELDDASEFDFDEIEAMSPERVAMEKAKTLRHVQAFLDSSKDKHYHEFHLEPLTGSANYVPWCIGLQVLLRMHQVWCVVGEVTVPLDKDHEMYPWYEHMVDVAVSLIYANVSQVIRSQGCVMSAVIQRSPSNMMQHIWAHFGQQDEEESKDKENSRHEQEPEDGADSHDEGESH